MLAAWIRTAHALTEGPDRTLCGQVKAPEPAWMLLDPTLLHCKSLPVWLTSSGRVSATASSAESLADSVYVIRLDFQESDGMICDFRD